MEYFHVYNVARRLEAANFPPLVMLATCLQHHYDSVMLSFYDPVQAPTQANLVRTEKDVLEREDQILVVDYVLKLGARFDFSDELGRRKMFSVCSKFTSLWTLRFEMTNFQRKCLLTQPCHHHYWNLVWS